MRYFDPPRPMARDRFLGGLIQGLRVQTVAVIGIPPTETLLALAKAVAGRRRRGPAMHVFHWHDMSRKQPMMSDIRHRWHGVRDGQEGTPYRKVPFNEAVIFHDLAESASADPRQRWRKDVEGLAVVQPELRFGLVVHCGAAYTPTTIAGDLDVLLPLMADDVILLLLHPNDSASAKFMARRSADGWNCVVLAGRALLQRNQFVPPMVPKE